MHKTEPGLQFSLNAQVLHQVKRCISEVSGEARIVAAEQVVRFLTSCESEDYVEFSVQFMEDLVRFMILYISELVSERVSILKTSKSTELFAEISLCDKLLRSLRGLQSDMDNRVSIHEGTYTALKISHQGNRLPQPRLENPNTANIDNLVERSILTRSSSSGYYMGMGLTSPNETGSYMRARARLIAYLFLCSQQMDAFFIGIDLLRQSGQHVSNVLVEIFLNTSIKFVRDRIWNHLSHKHLTTSSVSNLIPLIRRFEQRYPINCYDTQMNRQWSAIEGVTVGQGSGDDSNPYSSSQIECGNIADVSPSLLGDHTNIGNIGNLTLDESNNILRCLNCSSVDTHGPTGTRAAGDGYMHLTVSWMKKMTQKEIKMIFLDDVTAEEKFEFLSKQHDWFNMCKLLDDLEEANLGPENPFKVPFISPISQLVNEKIFSLAPPKNASPQSLAKVGLLLTGELASAAHESNLAWLMTEQSWHIPPQVVPIYLRRYGLWNEEIDSSITIPGDHHRIAIHGRLGITQLPRVSRWMSAMNPDYNLNLIRLCEYMFEGVPSNSDMEWICENFPQLEPFLRPVDQDKEHEFSTIYDLKTNEGDVSIRDLLADIYPEWRGWDLKFSDSISNKSSSPSLEYLLAQGRPSRAYLEHGLSSSSFQLSARRVAFYNLFHDGIVASAISFLDLCGESTETLRVDVQSARSILGPNHTRKRLDEVVSVFLSFSNGHSENLLKALKMLEEAAWIQEPPTGAGGDTLPAPAGESPWHLVALFCRVHNLPRSLTLLHELARNGDWVMFLHESDLQQCPIDTVRDVVRLYFVDNPLRSHLNILLDQGQDGREKDDKLLRSFIVETPAPPASPSQLLAKYLSLFQFEKARKLIEEFSTNDENLLHILHNQTNETSFLFESEVKALTRVFALRANESVSTPIAALDDDIGSLDASSFKGTLRGSSSSGVMVESLLTDDEDDAILLDQLRQALLANGTDGLENLRAKIDHDGMFRQVYSLLVNHISRGHVETEESYLQLIRVVSMDVMESFGVFLLDRLEAEAQMAPELETVEVRRDVCVLTYYAISNSFSDELHDRLLEYIKTDNRLQHEWHVICKHVVELRLDEIQEKKAVDVTISANRMFEICRKRLQSNESQAIVADLHCLLKVARMYAHSHMLRRHLEVNETLNAALVRLRSNRLV